MADLLKVPRTAVDGKHSGDAGFISAVKIVLGVANYRNDGDSGCFGALCYSNYHLAAKALAVKPAFACEDPVGRLQHPVKPNGIQDDIDAGSQRSAEECGHSGPHSAGGAAAGQEGDLAGKVAGNNRRKRTQTVIQQCDLTDGSTLLRGKHSCGAVWSIEWIVDIAHGGKLHIPQGRRKPGDINMGNLRQSSACWDEQFPGPVQKAHSAGCRSAAAAVVGRAVASTIFYPFSREFKRIYKNSKVINYAIFQ